MENQEKIGTDRSTGGGGSGGFRKTWAHAYCASGAGSNGTAYSGGSRRRRLKLWGIWNSIC